MVSDLRLQGMFRPSRHVATNVPVGSEGVAMGATSTAGAPRRCGGHVAVLPPV